MAIPEVSQHLDALLATASEGVSHRGKKSLQSSLTAPQLAEIVQGWDPRLGVQEVIEAACHHVEIYFLLHCQPVLIMCIRPYENNQTLYPEISYLSLLLELEALLLTKWKRQVAPSQQNKNGIVEVRVAQYGTRIESLSEVPTVQLEAEPV